jgi:hypothetical protein
MIYKISEFSNERKSVSQTQDTELPPGSLPPAERPPKACGIPLFQRVQATVMWPDPNATTGDGNSYTQAKKNRAPREI